MKCVRVGFGLACVALMGVSAWVVPRHASLSDAAKASSQVAFKLRSDAWAVLPHDFKPSDAAKPFLKPQTHALWSSKSTYTKDIHWGAPPPREYL